MTTPVQYDNSGKTAIVTGGAQGIGGEVARKLAQSGAQVFVWDLNEAKFNEAQFPDSVHLQKVDITDWNSISTALAKANARQVDILVNSAGLAGSNGPAWEYDISEWKRIYDVNVHGTFQCCRAVIPGMIKAGFGRIVNIASIAGKDGNPNAAAYSSSKAAVIGLTKSLGKELALTGVCVNAITPAAVRTAIFDQMSEEHIAFMLSKIPMQRFGKVEEMAALVLWLTSPDCSFSTGAVFDISGGRGVY
jgi:3-oxoacyl-[acyl-carrier protein] reductase